MKNLYKVLTVLAVLGAAPLLSGAICPTTASTNTDCGFILTIGPGGTVTGALVPGALPYDGADDALVGIVNSSGAAFTGSIHLTGSGNGGGIFAFDGDGICTFTSAGNPNCASGNAAPFFGYAGPLNSFANINGPGTAGDVVVTELADGATTYFSLEGSPASIAGGGGLGTVPEPASLLLLGTVAGWILLRRRPA